MEWEIDTLGSFMINCFYVVALERTGIVDGTR